MPFLGEVTMKGPTMPAAYVPPDSDARPNPIKDAFKSVGVALSGLGGVVATLVTLGVLTTDQADSVYTALDYGVNSSDVIGSLVSGAVAIIVGLVASFGSGQTAKGRVTPVEDPRAADGTPLTPAVETPPQP